MTHGSEMTDARPAPGGDAKRVVHEEAAHEKRQWIRLTSQCNNLCTFCLDTLAHNGTMASDDEVKARIIDGRRNGATRLILSGGEPTIHPSFVKYVKLGRMAGYRKVQIVTNGRMLSYPAFLHRALDAGLGEITFSIHGHNAKVHDALVGVPGAFDEAVEGIRLALEDGRPIVNIDVCLNRGNVRKLPELLDRFIAMGVGEYDLLHLIPFGMAWDRKHRDQLVYDIDEAMPYVQVALEYSERPDLHIWFNRFPPPYLEGFEYLIQDPYKLNDEARGRFEEYELWITRDMPISCREPERCDRCYLQHFCDSLESAIEGTRSGSFDAWRFRTDEEQAPPSPGDCPLLWLVGGDLADVRRHLGAATGSLILELDDWFDFAEALVDGAIDGRPVARVVVHDPGDLAGLLAIGLPDVTAVLSESMAEHLATILRDGHPSMTLALPNYERATEAAEQLPDLPAFFAAWTGEGAIENVPECVSGERPRPRLRTIDGGSLRRQELDYEGLNPGDTGGRDSLLKEVAKMSVGDPAKVRHLESRLGQVKPELPGPKLDLFGYVGDYVRNGFYTKSLRCRECARHAECAGLHVTTVRTQGYAMLKPILDDPK